jgi:phospholipid/cholesterol/gamma-HCH transport system ATP-binding protein
VDSRWGVLFQNGALFTSLNVLENVMAPLREHVDMPVSLMEEVAGMKIGLAGLKPNDATRFPAELSGGMRKRVALARALALDPEILFLDEPTAGLDPIGAAAFDSLVLELSRALGLTIMMITHDLDSLYAICDRVAVLADKQVEAVAPLRELLDNPHPWIQEYFHGPRGRAALAGKET